jgi:hypothetical protein
MDDKVECWGVVYLREDGTRANRIDHYDSKEKATNSFDKSTSIHGPYKNGNPRWRVAHFVEA